MNYISFSLWGDKPIYNVGGIRNAEQYKNFYTDWKMILYYDNSVPKETIEELKKLDVCLVDMTDKNINGYFWRFLAESIDDAEYVIFRDCDSRLSFREKFAVDEWINSGKSLHVMRDHPAHRIPYGNDSLGILAGMWGIIKNKINLKEMITEYNKVKNLNYGADQHFLKNIYTHFLNDMYVNDEFFSGLPFPIKRENGRFIGERINIDEQPLNDDFKYVL
jgi:hypothetical protein